MNKRSLITLLALTLGFLILATIRLAAGTGGFSQLNHWGFPDNDTIMNLRIHRVWTGSIVGATLGIAGVFLQSLLRNPLAAPDLMGLSAGAGFAVTLTIFITGASLSVGGATIPALIGAIAVLALVYALSQRRGIIDPVTMILIGVIVSVILGAATMLVASQMPDRGFGTSRWMMGNIREDLSQSHLSASTIITLAVLAVGLFQSTAYDAGSLPNDEAKSIGLRVGPIRTTQLLGAGLLTTISIVLAGPIGFVGLVSPHIVRVLIGPRHASLLIGSAVVGASMVVGADVLSRVIETQAGRIPIGVLTALIGGPVFLVLLLKQRTTQASQ